MVEQEQGLRAKLGFVDMRTQRPSKPTAGCTKANLPEPSRSEGAVRIGASEGQREGRDRLRDRCDDERRGFYLQVRKGLRSEPRQTTDCN